MSGATILVVEDDFSLREALCDTLELAGYNTVVADNGRSALNALEKDPIDMVVSDVQMEPMDGHALLKSIKIREPELPVLLITAYGTIQKAVEATRDGAVDYLVKPFEAEVLVNTVSRHVIAPRDKIEEEFIAVDPLSVEVLTLARRVASNEATVMITGESGTGKEVLARFIHKQSCRSQQPFVAINCAAIPDNMLEATLFGYEKGAFTGAYQASPGKFEQAQGGTLLLDEISEMDLGLQAKLLRVLQEREVERLGGKKLVSLDVRVLATSNRVMSEEVIAGRFREDLFYRLNVFPIQLPPLRQRPLDILPLAERILEKSARARGIFIPSLTKGAQAHLLAHPWRGNIRELDNILQRAMILTSNQEIVPEDLRFEAMKIVSDSGDLMESDHDSLEETLGGDLKNHEQKLIIEALEAGRGSRKLAAEKLGISPRTLRYKLARLREAGVMIP